MEKPEVKIPSMQERLAYMQSQRGVYKFNKETALRQEELERQRNHSNGIVGLSRNNY